MPGFEGVISERICSRGISWIQEGRPSGYLKGVLKALEPHESLPQPQAITAFKQ